MSTDRPIAVFDLDGTLTTQDSFLPFLFQWGRAQRRLGAFLAAPFILGGYAGRLLKDYVAKERMLIQFLRGAAADAIAAEAERFCRGWMENHWHPLGRKLLAEHQQAGHRLLLVSASPDVYVGAVGRMLGISEVICTRVRFEHGVCRGTLEGRNCKGAEKLRRLREHLGVEAAPAESYAYGDSRHDLPVLEWVSKGYLVDQHSARCVNAACPGDPIQAIRNSQGLLK